MDIPIGDNTHIIIKSVIIAIKQTLSGSFLKMQKVSSKYNSQSVSSSTTVSQLVQSTKVSSCSAVVVGDMKFEYLLLVVHNISTVSERTLAFHSSRHVQNDSTRPHPLQPYSRIAV